MMFGTLHRVLTENGGQPIKAQLRHAGGKGWEAVTLIGYDDHGIAIETADEDFSAALIPWTSVSGLIV